MGDARGLRTGRAGARVWRVAPAEALALCGALAIGCSSAPPAPSEEAALVVEANGGRVTTEAGGSVTAEVALSRPPIANVVVPLSTSDASEARVSPASLTFTPENWAAPQTVTVIGMDDVEIDGPQTYHLSFGPTESADVEFVGLEARSPDYTNDDDESAGIRVGSASGHTSEAGGEARFTVVLSARPRAEVTIALTSADPTEGEPSQESLVFTSGNWNVPQTVTVVGVDDDAADGAVTYRVELSRPRSEDAAYAALEAPPAVELINDDDDSAGVVVTAPADRRTTEAGGTATFTIRLATRPSADVVLGVASSDEGEASVSTAEITLTPEDWSVEHEVTVTGVDDDLPDGNQPYTVIFDAPTSTDAAYAALAAPPPIELSNSDDDTPGFDIGALSNRTEEGGSETTLRISLGTLPSAPVTLSFVSTDTSEGTLSAGSVVLTPETWSTPQSVTITGVDDVYRDGDQSYAVHFTAITTTDTEYAALALPADVILVNGDDDDVPVHMRTTYSEGGVPFYVAHSWYHTMMTTLGDTGGGLAAEDHQWVLVPGLADPSDPTLVSFRPAGTPPICTGVGGCYWRIDSAYPNRYPTCGEGSNRGYALCWLPESERHHLGWVDALVGDMRFARDATFRVVPALNGDPSMVSFQWLQDPTRYLRHAAYQVFASTNDMSPVQREDASFTLERAE